LDRQSATQVIFDKDRGLEILVRALGGEYLPLKNGVATGFNPLQLPITPANVEFLKTWLRNLSAGPLHHAMPAPRERRPIWIRRCGVLSPWTRRRGACPASWNFWTRQIRKACTRDLHAGARYVAGTTRGVFDNSRDTVVPRLAGRSVIGFDVTDFIDHSLTRSPITLYLFTWCASFSMAGASCVGWMSSGVVGRPCFREFRERRPEDLAKLNGVDVSRDAESE